MDNLELMEKLLRIVTEYDRCQSKRKHYNPNALAYYCRAVGEVVLAVKAGEPVEQALKSVFCGPLLWTIAKKLGLTHQNEQ